MVDASDWSLIKIPLTSGVAEGRGHLSSSLSVVIPLFNGEEWIAQTLESAMRQTREPSEIVVVDDGSTDDGAVLCLSIGKSSHVPIRVVSQKNAGQASARNNGVRAASSNLIAFLDADDIWLPTKLEKQMILLENENAGAVTCGYFPWDGGNGVPSSFLNFDWSMKQLKQWALGYGVGAALASTLLINRRLFLQLGGLREDMSIFTDVDFSLRLAQSSNVQAVHEPLVAYRQHSNQIHRKLEQLLPEARYFGAHNLTPADSRRLETHLYLLGIVRMLKQRKVREGCLMILRAPGSVWGSSLRFLFRRSRARRASREQMSGQAPAVVAGLKSLNTQGC